MAKTLHGPAKVVPLGQRPVQYFWKGDRYPIYFDRIQLPVIRSVLRATQRERDNE